MAWAKKISVGLVITLAVLATPGCAVYMAANQPSKKDVSVLKAGSPRSTVIAELGAPVHSSERAGLKVDVYNFVQGYSGTERGARAVLHGAADVLTFGLWEVVGTPIEGAANGTKVSVEVSYDKEDRVLKVVPIKGGEELEKNS